MKKQRSTLLALLLLCTTPALMAAPPDSAVDQEIHALLERLAASGCRFQRNGSWHEAAAARDHLLRKLDYLQGKSLAPSAEAFIERGATASSITGQPYQVQCGDAAAVPSQQWLLQQLSELRQAPNPR